MDSGVWVSLISGVTLAAAFGGILSFLGAEVRGRQRKREIAHELGYKVEAKAPETLDDRLQKLAEASETAQRLSREVSLEIDVLTTNATRARSEAEQAQHLISLNQKQRDAVASLVRGQISSEIKGSSRRDFWRSFWQNVLFFVLGVAASVIVTLVVRP